MVIDGKIIAQKITNELQIEVDELKSRGIIPTIAIITLGNEASWKTYVGQKIKLAEKLGINTKLVTIENSDEQKLLLTIQQCNNNNNVHGIIVQRPFAKTIDTEKVIDAILPKKDIDGFRKDSPYKVPVWLAVEQILHVIARSSTTKQSFELWIQSKNIAVIGRGETAGHPITLELERLNAIPIIYSSNSEKSRLNEAEIIISCVGKRVLETKNLKKGVIIIGVGTHRGEDGKIQGDYDETEAEQIASFYTPTPGGVGPVNLAYLFKNLIEATKE